MLNYYLRIEVMLSLISHKLAIVKYVVLKKIIFSFSVLTVSYGLGLDLDSNLLDLDLNLTRTRTSLDSVLTTALLHRI